MPCDSFLAYNIEKGEINGVDVTGLTYVEVVKIPGNVLIPHTWKRVSYVDARATDEQRSGNSRCLARRLGGPLADPQRPKSAKMSPLRRRRSNTTSRAVKAPLLSAMYLLRDDGAVSAVRTGRSRRCATAIFQYHPRRARIYCQGHRTRRQHSRTRNGLTPWRSQCDSGRFRGRSIGFMAANAAYRHVRFNVVRGSRLRDCGRVGPSARGPS